jgi:hypothetical protein
MKISNMTSSRGNVVPNQFIIHTPEATYFKSYDSIIIITFFDSSKRIVVLDKNYWDYSKTTSKYRNKFLGKTTKEIKSLIGSGEYLLMDLNQ